MENHGDQKRECNLVKDNIARYVDTGDDGMIEKVPFVAKKHTRG